MRYLLASVIAIIIFLTGSAFSQNILGKEQASPNSKASYSISISPLAKVDWQLIPAAYGTLISDPQTNHVEVQWNNPLSLKKDSSLCDLIAFIHIPNSETPLIYNKKILIRAGKEQLILASRNDQFSILSKDSLRFFYHVVCDESTNERKLIFTDSSCQKQSGFTRVWIIKTLTGAEMVETSDNPLTLNLNPGKYEVILTHVYAGASRNLTGTLYIYDFPSPSFRLSNPTPCEGSLVTFTNTSTKTEFSRCGSFHFGDGGTYTIQPKEKTAYYNYRKGQPMVLQPYFELNDLYGCSFKSKEQAIQIKQNKFSFTNISLEPESYTLKQISDRITISCKMGPNASPANPNTPFTYLWNTGQRDPEIMVTEGGNYTLAVTDRYDCKSNPLTAKVRKSYKEIDRPTVSGPSSVNAGSKLSFKMEPSKDCLYQWKFIYNNSTPITTPPSKESTIIPEGWEKSKPGTLSVIGILLKNIDGQTRSSYSDTLRVRIQ